MHEESLPGYWAVPATLLIVDPIDDNDQLLAKTLIEKLSEEAERNIEDETLERLISSLDDFRMLLDEEHLFLVLMCWAPPYRMLLPFTLGNFDLVLKDRLNNLISRAVEVAVKCKSDGFQVQRFTKENEDIQSLIISLLEEEMERMHFDALKTKDLRYDS